ncbi:uncharacterized protein N7473_007690 [Penicillium subrubescens]|uniref:Zn(2)-C6 fungal-type domain-containing protein n=1 Tax=Penicillium subrubescens TaxID=1316194 RepID=A0A1Q5UG14_9EURO|nr:uncharacterized protein N7473_007690 [Penicillium subrubescens]KAJ5891462.1 hypothetical protein N7473_007690 [Penicillium subrubescens]OKP11416.1 hypothetical protein PENSUB_3108 [Penicillium subrubescens]
MSDLPVNPLDPLGDPATPAPKKRTRVQFSCTACRFRKLKCDRSYPCTNCKKRGEAGTCTYVGRGPRGKAQHGRSSPTLVQDRLQHLENLVMSLSQKKRPAESVIDFNTGSSDSTNAYDTPPSVGDRETKQSPTETGTLVVKDESISYIDSADWRAVLEEIHGVKEYIAEHEISDQEDFEDGLGEGPSPALLLGMSRPVTKEEVLADIPPRPVADRLVSKFLKTTEPALLCLHIPTFQREYDHFWNNPLSMSFTWIALLFDILALSVSWFRRCEQALPSELEDGATAWDTFRKRAAQCLVQANYMTPGRYKCEALFIYAICEFYRSQDAQVGVSYLLTMTIHLAMRMGYHRDAKHYPSLSAFDGEMRRRLWALLCQLDILISFQVGIPRTIQPWHFDTELPSNLHDTEFDENTVQLPQGRSDEGEVTPCTYGRAKSRIMTAFGQAVDLAYSRETAAYDEILATDRRLEEAHNLLPTIFRIQPIAQCIALPTSLIMRRYSLELLYQKTRVVLHRRYMSETGSKYAYSRSVCLAAARETLRHHSDIWNESLPGGQLYAERFFVNSFQNTDFVLSAMILCLELSQDNERGSASRLGPQERTDLISLLEDTHRIFKDARRRSMDTQRAFAALTIMLSQIHGTSVDSLVAEPEEQEIPMEDQVTFQLASTTMDQEQYPTYTTASADDMQAAMYNTTSSTPSYSSLEVIGDMLSTPAQIDWRLYDSRVSGYPVVSQDNSWYLGAQALPTNMDFTYPNGEYSTHISS